MFANRLEKFLQSAPSKSETPSAGSAGFIACPVDLLPARPALPGGWQQMAYVLALERLTNQRSGVRLNFDMPAAWN